jgi:hypothetical protein
VKKGLRTVAVLLGLALGFSACGGSESIPTAPPPAGNQPAVIAITPAVVTTMGGGHAIISGTGFDSTVRVWLGTDAPQQIWVENAQTIHFWTNPHDAGTVDVVVRNAGGGEDTLARGFTFAPPESFDFNGTWIAHAGDDYGTDMRFVIENNRLTTVTCGSSPPVALTAAPAVSHGEFSAEGEGGVQISGRIVSATVAIGEITIAPCAWWWWADKSTAAQFAR